MGQQCLHIHTVRYASMRNWGLFLSRSSERWRSRCNLSIQEIYGEMPTKDEGGSEQEAMREPSGCSACLPLWKAKGREGVLEEGSSDAALIWEGCSDCWCVHMQSSSIKEFHMRQKWPKSWTPPVVDTVYSSGKTGRMHGCHDKSEGVAVRGCQPTILFSALLEEKGDQKGVLHGHHSVQKVLCHCAQSFDLDIWQAQCSIYSHAENECRSTFDLGTF